MVELISILTSFGLSTFKFFAGLIFAIESQIGLLPSYMTTIGGGIFGIIVFTHFGDLTRKWAIKKFNLQKRIFTKRNRMLVRFRQRFGLSGIAILSPVLLSLPVGIFLSLTLTKDKEKIIAFMLLSCAFWATVFLLPSYIFDVSLQELFKSIF